MRTVIVMPAYNEGKRVGDTVRSIFALGQDIHIVVIDDGSTDDTMLAAQEAGATVIRHTVNRGQGAALQTGTEWVLAHGADYIVHFDADGQFDAADIVRAVSRFSESAPDVILGSRMLASGNAVPITKKYFLFPIARIVNWAFTGLWLTDVHNGFRVLSRRAAERIIIEEDGMAHNTEIINHIRRAGLTFSEMPVTVRYHRYGQGLRGGFKIVGDLLLSWFV